MSLLRIAIVDDHMVVRDGIRAMAERTDGLVFVGEASTGEEASDLLRRDAVDILLLDYRLEESNGFELCTKLRASYPNLLILVFTAFGNPELLAQAIRAGADGYALKDTNTRRLPEALRILRDNGSYFDPRLAGQTLIATIRNAGRVDRNSLTERDMGILRLIAEGKANHEIADALFLSPHTVKFHITKLLRKFNVSRRSELAKIAGDMYLTR